jgi:hypothetical protein
MKLHLERGKGVPDLRRARQGRSAMEECPICCPRCEGAIGCPLPDEAILALANVDALNRTPESEELHDGVHRQLASDVSHPCRVVEPMLNGSAPPYPRPNNLTRAGAIASGVRPLIQASSQKRSREPSPMTIRTEAWNIATASGITSKGIPAQGFSRSVFWNHNQRARSATFSFLRLWNPSPPRCLGSQTFSQATRQHPPRVSTFPAQRKPRRRRSPLLIKKQKDTSVFWKRN